MRLTLLRCAKPGSWHVSPAPAAHPHSLAPPRRLSKPGLWHVSPAPQLKRTAGHHLVSYQSLGPGMYRQRLHVICCCTTSSAITAWFRARIANACSSATHTHSSAPPPQLSPRLPSFELLRTVVRLMMTCRFWLLKTNVRFVFKLQFQIAHLCNLITCMYVRTRTYVYFKLHICAI